MGQQKKHRILEGRSKRLGKAIWGLVRLLCCSAAKAAVDNKPAPQPGEERLANHKGNKKRPLEVQPLYPVNRLHPRALWMAVTGEYLLLHPRKNRMLLRLIMAHAHYIKRDCGLSMHHETPRAGRVQEVCKDVTVQCVCAHWIEDINPVQTQQQGKIYPSLANTPCQLPIIMISSQEESDVPMTSSAGGNAEQKKADLAACQAMLVSPAKGKPSCTAQTGTVIVPENNPQAIIAYLGPKHGHSLATLEGEILMAAGQPGSESALHSKPALQPLALTQSQPTVGSKRKHAAAEQGLELALETASTSAAISALKSDLNIAASLSGNGQLIALDSGPPSPLNSWASIPVNGVCDDCPALSDIGADLEFVPSIVAPEEDLDCMSAPGNDQLALHAAAWNALVLRHGNPLFLMDAPADGLDSPQPGQGTPLHLEDAPAAGYIPAPSGQGMPMLLKMDRPIPVPLSPGSSSYCSAANSFPQELEMALMELAEDAAESADTNTTDLEDARNASQDAALPGQDVPPLITDWPIAVAMSRGSSSYCSAAESFAQELELALMESEQDISEASVSDSTNVGLEWSEDEAMDDAGSYPAAFPDTAAKLNSLANRAWGSSREQDCMRRALCIQAEDNLAACQPMHSDSPSRLLSDAMHLLLTPEETASHPGLNLSSVALSPWMLQDAMCTCDDIYSSSPEKTLGGGHEFKVTASSATDKSAAARLLFCLNASGTGSPVGDSPKIAAGRSLLSNMEIEACADVDGITRTAAVNPGMAAKHAAAAVRKTAEAAERSNWTSAKRLPQGAPDMPKPQCTASADVGGEVSEEDAAWPAPSETTASGAEESAPPMSALSAGNIAAAPSDVNITTVDAIPATSRTQEAASLPSCLQATGSDKNTTFKQKAKAKVKKVKQDLKGVAGKMKAGFSKLLRLCN